MRKSLCQLLSFAHKSRFGHASRSGGEASDVGVDVVSPRSTSSYPRKHWSVLCKRTHSSKIDHCACNSLISNTLGDFNWKQPFCPERRPDSFYFRAKWVESSSPLSRLSVIKVWRPNLGFLSPSQRRQRHGTACLICRLQVNRNQPAHQQ